MDTPKSSPETIVNIIHTRVTSRISTLSSSKSGPTLLTRIFPCMAQKNVLV